MDKPKYQKPPKKPPVESKRIRKARINRELMAKAAGQTAWPIDPKVASKTMAGPVRGLPRDIEKFKAENDYEHNPPHCHNCTHFQVHKRMMINSIPVHNVPDMCGLGSFRVKPNAICNAWQGRDGSTLES